MGSLTPFEQSCKRVNFFLDMATGEEQIKTPRELQIALGHGAVFGALATIIRTLETKDEDGPIGQQPAQIEFATGLWRVSAAVRQKGHRDSAISVERSLRLPSLIQARTEHITLNHLAPYDQKTNVKVYYNFLGSSNLLRSDRCTPQDIPLITEVAARTITSLMKAPEAAQFVK